MHIVGRNGEYDGKLSPTIRQAMKKAFPTLTEDALSIIGEIDNWFNRTKQNAKTMKLVGEDGKVDWSKGYYFHKVSDNITEEVIDSICENGILPIERFGTPEVGHEMRFCVGVTRCDDIEHGTEQQKRYLYNNKGQKTNTFDKIMSVIGGVSLIIDPSIVENGTIDYFEYVRTGKCDDKKMKYVLDTLFKEVSPEADKMVNGDYRESYEKFHWGAIAGGVPPEYIVGVFFDRKDPNLDPAEIEKRFEIAKRFASTLNVPIVTEDGVVHEPKSSKREHANE